jgi:death-on-curing protein
MSGIVFLKINDVIAINKRAVEEFGGIESALTNPQNLYFYKNANLYEVAASYACAIIQNHAFLDGNKRTGFACMFIFLMQNDIKIKCEIDDTVAMMVKIATKEKSFEEVVEWLRGLEC